jgi:hypothetical protein
MSIQDESYKNYELPKIINNSFFERVKKAIIYIKYSLNKFTCGRRKIIPTGVRKEDLITLDKLFSINRKNYGKIIRVV